jgi:hypothetical protein
MVKFQVQFFEEWNVDFEREREREILKRNSSDLRKLIDRERYI